LSLLLLTILAIVLTAPILPGFAAALAVVFLLLWVRTEREHRFSFWSGSLYGRFVGITAAGLSAIGALLSIPAYSFWSLAIFAMDIIIHQIAAHGTEGRRPAA
jgi:hypothetical protein